MAKPLINAEEVEVKSRAELRDWLGVNHGRGSGVWLVHHKKASPHYLPMRDIVAECLAHGWVDSLVRTKDELRAMHWIAPRKAGSNWSAVNKAIVDELEAGGLMTPPGHAAIEAAKADGSWTRLDAVERLEVPDDLADAFAAHPGSRGHWDAFPKSVRRGVLEWILNAKRADTRAKRIADVAERAGRNERANQWR
ncbi:MAG: YdeI/OmpD-associated family protein [Pseudomonadota bacterium]